MKFSDIIGNEKAIEQIRRLVDADQIPHALLLYGDSSVPKLALARATAQYIHCTDRQNGDSCGKCPSCLQHQSLNHGDTFFSFPVTNKGENTTSDLFMAEWKQFLNESPIENYEHWLALLKNENAQPQIYASESNAIIRKMSLSSFTAKYKVLVMWLPEKMNEACANKLLKLIEEPDHDSLFILVSNNEKALLPTIFSRTQRIQLRRPSVEQIAQYLQANMGTDYNDALVAAASADANVTQAIQNLEAQSETKAFHEKFVSLMRLAYMRNIKALKEWSEQIADYKREKSRRFLIYCARMVRENFIYNLKNPELNYLTTEEQQFSSKFAPFINEQNVEQMIAEFSKAESDIQRNANAKITLFDLAIKVTILIKK